MLGVIASLIAISGAAFAGIKAFAPTDNQPRLSEKRQIVAFHQLANRICAENSQALNRAFPAARSRIELLAYLSRATNWGIGDLSGITPPSTVAADFTEEIRNRQQIADDLLNLQLAIEIGDAIRQAGIKAKLAAAENRASELNLALGLRNCAPVLPARSKDVAS